MARLSLPGLITCQVYNSPKKARVLRKRNWPNCSASRNRLYPTMSEDNDEYLKEAGERLLDWREH